MPYTQIILLLLILKMIVSCSPNSEELYSTCENESSEKNSLIIGNNDWVHYLETGDYNQNQNEQTVGLISIPKLQAKCTGFLINEDTLMTNNHCIPDEKKSEGVSVLFRKADGSRTKYNCSDFIMTNFILDFTLVKCEGSPGQEFGWAGLANDRPVLEQHFYLIQENCDYIRDPRCVIDKYISFGSIEKIQSKRIHHNADTLGGSSGSPLFSQDSHQVIGIHNSGYYGETYDQNLNLGIPMFQIKSYIESASSIRLYEHGPYLESIEERILNPCHSLR